MVSFLRDVMIVVAIVVTLVALAFYPGHESVSHPTAQTIPVGVPPAPAAGTTPNVDAGAPNTVKPQ